MYGTVLNVTNNANLRLGYGALTWVFQPLGGGPAITATGALTNINNQYSYILRIPCETQVPGFAASSNTIQLSGTPITYNRSQVLWNTNLLAFVQPLLTNTTFSATDRGRIERVDLTVSLPMVIDFNGLPVDWELTYFGRTGIDPNADPDGDGMSNLAEYMAGTDPNDPASALSFTEIAPLKGGIQLKWESAGYKSYALQRSPNPSGNYIDIQTGIAATAPTNTWLDATALGLGPFYYRLRLRALSHNEPASMSIRRRLAVYAAALCGCTLSASAQWMTQTLNLRQGWNAVFLEVQPNPPDCDTVFAGQPIESVWFWNQRFSTVQYIADPNSLLPGQRDWLTYLPANSTNRATANLFTLLGGHAYLIKATAAASLTLRGQPLIRNPDWLADSFNLAGFYVSSNSPPTFQSLFAPSSAHAGQPVFRLNASGSWVQVVSPSTTTLAQGESFWVRCAGASGYPGFLKITFERGRTLDYGRTLIEQTLRIKNTSSNATTFTIKPLASGIPPNPGFSALAGPVPLSYWRMNFTSNQVGWVNLPAQLNSPSISPGAEWALRLAVRRADMNAFSLPAGYTDALYQTLLEVTDTLGSHALVPVSASGLRLFAPSPLAAGGLRPNDSVPPDPHAGLWVGSVVLSNVNQAAISSVPVPTASQFQFRLILHVDSSGDTRLLQKVILAWTNGVYTTNQQGFRQAISPGRFALITDESLLSRFSGSSLRDGTVSGRRFSSAAFGFRDPILVSRTGQFCDPRATFSCTVPLGFDDALNPFKHRYHPDHNNLDDRYAVSVRECPDVTRQISFQFSAQDPENTTLAGWGDNQLGGIYNEVITGLHKNPVTTQGIFRLYRASTVDVLNDVSF